ncbi:MAG: CHAT domain-containing protein [Symploca sp. SIO2E6]|nr:CHAT domain-containing protein [Symploca sp. SIO2E6]
MSKVVKLNLEYGDLSQGFQITLEIDDGLSHRQVLRTSGSLPANLQVGANYDDWQETYRCLETVFRRPVVQELPATEPPEECQIRFGNLKTSINHWLSAEEFRSVKEQLLKILNKDEEIRLIIRSNQHDLRRLPWETWDFFDDFPHAAVAISPTKYGKVNPVQPQNRVKILAILGNSEGINIAKDRDFLENLPQAEVHFLVEPQRHQLETLWDEEWHILFFAGHSYSQGDGDCGYIYINQTEKLAISDLRHTLQHAIDDQKLQLAIFNSCDGLGLANELQQLNIPQMIVMREPVPDQFAQEFLKYFLKSFSSGQSLYSSVRKAQKKLHDLSGIESRFPGASFLPVICQNPTVAPITWDDFLVKPEVKSEPPPTTVLEDPPAKNNLLKLIGITIAAIGLLPGTISLVAIGSWLWWGSPICSFRDSRTKLKIKIPQGQIFNYGGSTTSVSFAEALHEELKTTLPDFQLSAPKYSGSMEGIQQLLEGYFAFSLSSSHLQPQHLAQTRQQGGYQLIQESVAIDAIVVGVHPQLQVPSLTLTQLKDIYTGKIRNWQQVGGANVPITPYSRKPAQSGTVQFFIHAVLGGKPFNNQIVQWIDSTTTGIGKVSNDPGGIYYASATELVPQCGIRTLPLGLPGKTPIAPYRNDFVPLESCPQQRNQINFSAFKSREYPLTRNLFVTIKDFPGKEDAQEQAGRAYSNFLLTGKGQAIIKEHGFVPVAKACRK